MSGVLFGVLITLLTIGGFIAAFFYGLGGKRFPWILLPFLWIMDIFWDFNLNGLRNLFLLTLAIFLIWFGFHHVNISVK